MGVDLHLIMHFGTLGTFFTKFGISFINVPNFVKEVPNFVKDVPIFLKDVPNFVKDVPMFPKSVMRWGTTFNNFLRVSK